MGKGFKYYKKVRKEKGIDLLKPFEPVPGEFKDKDDFKKKKQEAIDEYIHIFSLGDYEESVGEEFVKGIFTTKYYKGEKFTLEHRKKVREKE